MMGPPKGGGGVLLGVLGAGVYPVLQIQGKNFHSSSRLRRVGFGLGRLKLIKHSSNRMSKIYLEQHFFFSFVRSGVDGLHRI